MKILKGYVAAENVLMFLLTSLLIATYVLAF